MFNLIQSWRSYLHDNRPAWVAAAYVAFSCLWIFFTDKLLERLSLTPAETTVWSIFKGFVYVAITSSVIYVLMRRVKASKEGLEDAVARRTAELAASQEKLRQGEEWLRRLLASLPDVTWTSARDGRTIFISPNVESVYGFSPEEIYQDGEGLWLGRIHPQDRQRVIDNFHALFSRGQRFDEEYQVQRKDGRWIWVHDRAVRTHRQDGREFADGIFTDITVRKNAEQARDESEKRYRLLFERNLAGVFRAEAGGRVLDCNPAMVRILGYASAAELTGSSAAQILYDPAEQARLLDVLDHDGAINNVEILLRRKDGTPIWGLHNVCFLPPENGGPPCIEGTVIDISQRKQAEEVLSRQLSLMQAITSTAADGLMMVDAEGRLTFMNPAAERMFGYTLDELLGKNVHDICHYKRPDGTPLAGSECPIAQACMAGRTLHSHEDVHFHKNGTAFHVSCSSAPLIQGGILVGSVLVVSDITQRKQREDQYQSLHKQFLHAQKMEAIGRLAGGVAHDFNNLVQIVNGYAGLIADEAGPNTLLSKQARAIKDAGSRAAQLTQQLLAFSRQDAGEPPVTPIDPSVTEVMKMARSLVREDIQLVTHLDGEAACVKIPAGQLEQLIMNLVVNARDAMPGGGTVTIETRCVHLNEAACVSYGGVLPGRYVLLSVSDTGCGMDAEVRNRIFEPFFTTKQRGKGTGLGLSTVYGIVTQNQGGIWLESQPGIGTTFSLCLPVAARKVYPAIARADLTPSKGTENVLLAEDEADLRKLISNQLGKLGYRVMEADNGVEALNLAMNTSQTIDLLVSDMIMPRMGGQELSERIRTLYPKVKILQITGYSDTPQQPDDLTGRGIRYLQKPFTLDSLANAVRQALDH